MTKNLQLFAPLKLCLFIIYFFSTNTVYSSPSNDPQAENKKILILHSYHEGYNWTDRIMEGINSVFKQENVELFVNYMDTKRCVNEDYFSLLYQIYKQKYAQVQFDAILSTDDHALNFLLHYKEDLFPDVPLVFCGINDFQPEQIKNHKNITGTFETYDVFGTIHLIRKLHPNLSSIAVINDASISGQAFLNRVNRVEQSLKDSLLIEHLSNLSRDSLQIRLSQLPKGCAVIWGIYIKTPSGKVLTHKESINLVKQSTKLPVYCIWDVVGSGVIGGKITSPFYQGEKASKSVMQILAGKDISKMEISGSPMIYKFDHSMLKKYDISEDDLPSNRIIINKDDSIYEQYKSLIWTTAIIISVLMSIILGLSHLLKKISATSKKLTLANHELEIAKDKAEESDRLKTSFLANLSHEIRTPMNGIVGFTELLEFKNISAEKQRKYINMIKLSSQRMLELINNLVDISRIETNQIEIIKSGTNLSEVMQNMYHFFLPIAQKKNLNLRYSIDFSQEFPLINTDQTKLEQVISNLLINAIKFTQYGEIELACKMANNLLTFSVSDTGVGIDESMHQIIFKRFRHAENKSTKTEEGSGLGLAISKSIVELMGGEIRVESELNRGSKFIFTLPFEEALENENQEQNSKLTSSK
ncbi:sensor histidine kinase [Marinifilum flexuosum]|uniref:histidine kinase n=1 Tax=Marinifilum flexuosum TaxID=1117708 RepID=A0A419X3C7_9BACT|nr:ABC transporter substrate binding protein [Marinifilum flexuosum]RKE02120.1 signal transduction histidine kinase [Marinifilum flexuosum]